jgi:CheY-like chemotaxis protein
MPSPVHGIIGMSACLLDSKLPKDQAMVAQRIFENSKFLRATISDLPRTDQVQPSTMNEQPTPFVMQPPHKEEHKDGVVTRIGSITDHAWSQSAIPRNIAPPPQLDIHILLVERNAIMRKIMTKIAERSGYRMNIVETGQDALHYLCRNSQQSKPKVVLMNCTMQAPPIDGYEATRRIRNDYTIFDAETRNLPIIGLTILGHNDNIEKCLSAGMDDSLSKPLRVSVFKDKMIKWMVARKSYKAGHIVDAKL